MAVFFFTAQVAWEMCIRDREASNANPVNYKNSVNTQYGESSGLEEFCEKAQMLNIEVMKGMYEACLLYTSQRKAEGRIYRKSDFAGTR